MKIFIPLYIGIILYGCALQHPKLIKSTKQAWWSISSGNSNGTVYHIVIKVSADTTLLKFDSIRIANYIIKDFNFSILGQSNTNTYYRPSDSILISFNNIGFIDTMANSKKNTPIIYYSLNNKNRQCKIDSIKTLESLICP